MPAAHFGFGNADLSRVSPRLAASMSADLETTARLLQVRRPRWRGSPDTVAVERSTGPIVPAPPELHGSSGQGVFLRLRQRRVKRPAANFRGTDLSESSGTFTTMERQPPLFSSGTEPDNPPLPASKRGRPRGPNSKDAYCPKCQDTTTHSSVARGIGKTPRLICSRCNYRTSQPRYARLRALAMEHYGNRCACCGETEPFFLAFDHVNNDGAAHRKSLGFPTGNGAFVVWIVKNNFPSTIQILCCNCNWGKFRNGGICPHKADPPSKKFSAENFTPPSG